MRGESHAGLPTLPSHSISASRKRRCLHSEIAAAATYRSLSQSSLTVRSSASICSLLPCSGSADSGASSDDLRESIDNSGPAFELSRPSSASSSPSLQSSVLSNSNASYRSSTAKDVPYVRSWFTLLNALSSSMASPKEDLFSKWLTKSNGLQSSDNDLQLDMLLSAFCKASLMASPPTGRRLAFALRNFAGCLKGSTRSCSRLLLT
mmetsp:Transcript_60461/g.176756  ORF Transcript_60461/g.176756 Transcript_60461/m.176756 type:complete len:207 (-) Transcript_60461:1537-2157(-)